MVPFTRVPFWGYQILTISHRVTFGGPLHPKKSASAGPGANGQHGVLWLMPLAGALLEGDQGMLGLTNFC